MPPTCYDMLQLCGRDRDRAAGRPTDSIISGWLLKEFPFFIPSFFVVLTMRFLAVILCVLYVQAINTKLFPAKRKR